MLTTFAYGLGLTLAVELCVALLWGLRGRDLALCALVNVLTNPVAVYLHWVWPAAWLAPVLEGAAVGAEGLLYRLRGEGIRRPFLLSLWANLCSFGLGYLLGGI